MVNNHYTEKNVFDNKAFLQWFNQIDPQYRKNILEPFAGRNDIIKSLMELQLIADATSYDINPQHEKVKKRDVLHSFPKRHKIIVTNPPYLARSSATRQNVDIKIDPYNDLYELCLAKCLQNGRYVAAIIPESFITSGFFKDRLDIVISLPQKKIFKQTEHPVCLALFGKKKNKNFEIYRNDIYLGSFLDLKKKEKEFFSKIETTNIHSNRSYGSLGLIAIDNCIDDQGIKFCMPKEVQGDVDSKSRLRTVFEINVPITEEFIIKCNKVLKEYRQVTQDVFLTSFKSLRADGVYRRRIDFLTAKKIIAKAIKNI